MGNNQQGKEMKYKINNFLVRECWVEKQNARCFEHLLAVMRGTLMDCINSNLMSCSGLCAVSSVNTLHAMWQAVADTNNSTCKYYLNTYNKDMVTQY